MCPLNWEQILKMDMTQLCYKDKNGPPFHRIWRGKSPKCLFLREKITNWFGVCFHVNLYSCPGLFPMPHQSTNGRMSAGMLKRVTSLVLLLSLMHLNATTLWPCLGKLWCTELLRQREMDIKLFIWTGLYSFISWRMVGYMLVDTDGWHNNPPDRVNGSHKVSGHRSTFRDLSVRGSYSTHTRRQWDFLTKNHFIDVVIRKYTGKRK